jgi:hypothetical protein
MNTRHFTYLRWCVEGNPRNELRQLHVLLLRKIPLSSKTLVISRVTWEKALLKYCSGEGDLLTEAQDLQDRGYAGLGIAVRYNGKKKNHGIFKE